MANQLLFLTDSSVLSPLASALGDVLWKPVSIASQASGILLQLSGTGYYSQIFTLKYDAGDRIGMYCYDDYKDQIHEIIAAPNVDIVTTPTGTGGRYEIWVDGRTIKIRNAASSTMTFSTKIIS